MANADMSPVSDAARPRVAADTGAAVILTTRLQEAAAALAAVRSEFATLLAGVESAVGTGQPAHAFREGFSPAGAAAAKGLQDVENRLDERRRAVVAGIDALVDRDVEASTRIDRAEA